MKTRWMIPITAIAVFTLTTGAYGQIVWAAGQTSRPSLSSATPVAQSSAGVARYADQTLPQPPEAPEPPQPPPPPAPPAPPTPPQPAQEPKIVRSSGTTTPAAEPAQAKRQKSSPINVRLEFTVTDQTGTKAPAKKTVMMLVADGESGRIRTNNLAFIKTGSEKGQYKGDRFPLNIDAAPEVEGNRVRLSVSLDLTSPEDSSTPEVPAGNSTVQQSVTSIVGDGVTTILSQSADPVTDRRVTLEVKATILK